MQLVSSLLAATALLTTASATTYSPPAPVRRQTRSCNSSPSLCDMQYNQITHMGAHDSSFLRDESTKNSLAGNQYLNATKALDAGFRLLQGQVHALNGVLHLCHTTCDLLDAGPLQQWLTEIAFWVDNHPNDVITILLVNSDSNTANEYGVLFDAAGLGQYGYVPPSASATGNWPTLANMIADNKRMVSFVTNINAPSATYPYILNEFTYVFETSFEVTTAAGFNCSLDRPANVGSAASAVSANMLPLINHFMYQDLGSGIYIPDVGEIENTNSADTTKPGSLGKHAMQCRTEWGVQPVFVLVDFWNEGPAIKAADLLNQVSAPVGRKGDGASGGSVVRMSALALAGVAIAALLL